MSNIFLYDRPLKDSIRDYMRATETQIEDKDLHSTDISTFTNNDFVFYVPPPTDRIQECPNPTTYGSLEFKYRDFNMTNLSSIQLFSYENGAKVTVEWFNCTVVTGATFDIETRYWDADNAEIKWLSDVEGPKTVKKTYKLGEYDTEEIQLSAWMVNDDTHLLSGVVKITSDNPISVMHHKYYPTGTEDNDKNKMVDDMIYYNWDGLYSAYGKKLFTRISGDCWISALEANTEVHVWDRSGKDDDTILTLDRFEGWDYSRNAIFNQYGFDDDLVLISADKPVSIVAGMQTDQGFVQIFGKDGRDFHFPCIGYIMIHAPDGAEYEIKDKTGNQGSKKGSLSEGQIKLFDFKVAYKQRRYSSFEWAELRSSEPIFVYTFSNSTWFLDENRVGKMSGEEYLNTYKKTTEFYSHGVVPYPADTHFKIPLRSRAKVTVVNLDKSGNDLTVDFDNLLKDLPFKAKMKPYQSITLDYSENSYYPMDLLNDQTGNQEDPSWLYSDPDRRYAIDSIPHISAHEVSNNLVEDAMQPWLQKVSWENITKGSVVNVKTSSPVLVLIEYSKDDSIWPQGIDLIPGLSPPSIRGLPEFPTLIVIISGLIIAVDMVIVVVGRKSIVEMF